MDWFLICIVGIFLYDQQSTKMVWTAELRLSTISYTAHSSTPPDSAGYRHPFLFQPLGKLL